MNKATCRTCGASGPPWHHVPSVFDPDGIADPGHRMTLPNKPMIYSPQFRDEPMGVDNVLVDLADNIEMLGNKFHHQEIDEDEYRSHYLRYVNQAKAALHRWAYEQTLELIGEDEHFEGSHKEKSYDTYLNVYKDELRQAAKERYGQ